jgi:tetratricopeptide (TPR) repeat protein
MRLSAILAVLLATILASTPSQAQSASDIRAQCIKQITGRDTINGRTPFVPDIHQPAVLACVQQAQKNLSKDSDKHPPLPNSESAALRQHLQNKEKASAGESNTSTAQNGKFSSQKNNPNQIKQDNTKDKLERCATIGIPNAINSCNEVLSKDPENLSALVGRAQIFAAQKKYDLAFQDLSEMIRIDSKNPQTHYLLGVINASSGDLLKAKNAFSTAIDLDPNFIDAYIARGKALDQLGLPTFALDDFDQALRINPSYHQANFYKGLIFVKQNNYEGAISSFTKAISFRNDATYYFERAMAYDSSKQFELALSDLNSAKSFLNSGIPNSDLLKKINSQIPSTAANAKIEKDKKTVINEKLKKCQDYPEENAIVFCNEVLGLDQDNLSALVRRSQIYAIQNKNDLALRDLQEMLRIDPKNAQPHFLIGLNNARTGNLISAKDDFSRAIELFPKFPDAYYARGVALYQLGSPAPALDDFNKSIEINPSYHQANFYKGIIFFDQKNYDEAISNFTKAISSSNEAMYYFERAMAFSASNRFTQAINDLDSAKRFLGQNEQYPTLNQINSEIDSINNKIKAEKEKAIAEEIAAIRTKGLQFAQESNTSWQLRKDNDSISDTQNLFVISNQKSSQGTAFIQVIGRCEGKLAKFRVTILGRDENRAPTVPGRTEFGIPIKYRVDDGDVLSFRTPNDKFSNALVLARVSPQRNNDGHIDAKKIENQNSAQLMFGREWNALQLLSGNPDILGTLDDRNWRVLAQIETSEGPVLAKLPLYHPEVQKLIKSCS